MCAAGGDSHQTLDCDTVSGVFEATCGPTSTLTTTAVPSMADHANLGASVVHHALGNSVGGSAFWNGCVASCAGACATGNADVADDAPIYYCTIDDTTGYTLDFPRCAADCETAALATSCVGLCVAGTYCCASTGGSCIPTGTPCPCPDCATRFADGGCTEDGPLYFEVQTGSSATKCCAPSPPAPPPPSPPPMPPPSPPPPIVSLWIVSPPVLVLADGGACRSFPLSTLLQAIATSTAETLPLSIAIASDTASAHLSDYTTSEPEHLLFPQRAPPFPSASASLPGASAFLIWQATTT